MSIDIFPENEAEYDDQKGKEKTDCDNYSEFPASYLFHSGFLRWYLIGKSEVLISNNSNETGPFPQLQAKKKNNQDDDLLVSILKLGISESRASLTGSRSRHAKIFNRRHITDIPRIKNFRITLRSGEMAVLGWELVMNYEPWSIAPFVQDWLEEWRKVSLSC